MKIKILTIFFALAISIPLFSQTRSRLSKIGFISSSQIYESVINDVQLLSIIDKVFADNQMKLNTMAAELTKLREIMENPDTSESLRKDTEKTLLTKEAEYNKLVAQLSTQGKRDDVVKLEINKHIASSIYVITRREGYTAIIEKDQSVLFVDKEFDITNLVLSYVRESIRKMEVK